MIESSFWRPELLKTATSISRRSKLKRWTEKQAVLFEREIMLGMFCVRVFIENKKIPDRLAQKKIAVLAYPSVGRAVTLLNRFHVDENYHWDRAEKKEVTLEFLCHQIIHSYVIYPLVDGKTFSDLIVCSDWEKNRFLYRLPISSLVALIRETAETQVRSLRYHSWSKRRADFIVETS